MDNFIIALNVVLPLFLMMALGYLLKVKKLFNDDTLTRMNAITFKTSLPALLFYNIYTTNLSEAYQPKLMVYGILCVLAMFVFLCVFIPMIEKNPRQRGVMVQGIFRSNFVILGVPIVTSLFGEGASGVTSIMAAVVVPFFNVLAVIALEIYRGGKVNVQKILQGIVTNPLIIGAALGMLCLLTDFHLPLVLEKTIGDLAKIATPLALIILGGSFAFSSVHNFLKQLIITVTGRLIVVPVIFVGLAIALGFRGVNLVTLLAMFSAPTAVSSFTMAEQMDGDADLAGQIVVFSSLFCILTLFIFIFILKHFGLI